MKKKIRYKYVAEERGFSLNRVRCPVCGSRHINWVKSINDYNWNHSVVLLAECWSGDLLAEKPRHLFLIRFKDLPEVEARKVAGKCLRERK